MPRPEDTSGAQPQSWESLEVFTSAQVDMDELEDLRRRGLVTADQHPELPLTVHNYTAKRHIREEEWTPLLSICRGLVIDPDGVVVARPFPRMRELRGDQQLPPGAFTAYEKLDGSMGVQYPTPEGPMIATRGRFMGRQAVRGSQLLAPYRDFDFGEGVTPIWEIVYPENRIVVDYGDREEVVLLGLVKTQTGKELPLPDQADVPFSVVPSVEGVTGADELRAMERPNAEGYVVRMHETGDRFKVKFPAFDYLVAMRRGTMPYKVWRELMGGVSTEDLLASTPGGAQEGVALIAQDLQAKYDEVVAQVRAAAVDPSIDLGTQPLNEAAARFRNSGRLNSSAIWAAVRPSKNPVRDALNRHTSSQG